MKKQNICITSRLACQDNYYYITILSVIFKDRLAPATRAAAKWIPGRIFHRPPK